jgi:Rrf2 family transcriptional regulator, iron-sulfur cluster assembly transcription factor
MIYVANESTPDRRVNIKQIAEATQSPEAFTAKILQLLAKHNLIDSLKGPNGGFYMDANKRETVFLSHIVKAIDGDKLYTGCGLGLKQCSESHPCPVHDEFKIIRNRIEVMLKSTNIQKLTEGLHAGLSFLKS